MLLGTELGPLFQPALTLPALFQKPTPLFYDCCTPVDHGFTWIQT